MRRAIPTSASTARQQTQAPRVGPAGRMSLADHLRELRNRTLICLVVGLVAVGACYYFWQPLYDLMRAPYCDTTLGRHNCDLYALGVLEQFQVRMRVAVVAGIVVSAPVWLFHIGRYITPALHRHERRYALGFLAGGVVLFGAGVVSAYLTMARGLEIFLDAGGGHVVPLITVQSYLSFMSLLLLAFGLAFQFPLVVMFLNLTGTLSSQRMRSSRRGVIFALMLVCAVLVPTTDPFTFLAVALPLVVLYELCIIAATVRDKVVAGKARGRDAQHAELLAELGLEEVSAGL
ncbi:MAG: Sec-independent protein translocase TatC [Frankiales bacterium]|nr:Sec-independent protein translocase TatC [Frankiales bacterium]